MYSWQFKWNYIQVCNTNYRSQLTKVNVAYPLKIVGIVHNLLSSRHHSMQKYHTSVRWFLQIDRLLSVLLLNIIKEYNRIYRNQLRLKKSKSFHGVRIWLINNHFDKLACRQSNNYSCRLALLQEQNPEHSFAKAGRAWVTWLEQPAQRSHTQNLSAVGE